MMSIGEFAALSGLTIRALRHYDEEGILTPAEVDSATRYRRYSAAQLPRAMKLAALRRADLPLAEIIRILDGEAEMVDVIASRRAQLDEERARQEELLGYLELVAALEAQVAAGPAAPPVTVTEQVREAGDWVGIEFVSDEAAVARAKQLGEDLLAGEASLEIREDPAVTVGRALAEIGNRIVGPSWLSLEASDESTTPAVLLCWPVAEPVPDGFALLGSWTDFGWRGVTGRITAGRELVARGSFESLSVFEQSGQLPGVVAVLREAERRGIPVDLGSVRATRPEPSADGQQPPGFELAIGVVGSA